MKFPHTLSQAIICLSLLAFPKATQAYQGSTNTDYSPALIQADFAGYNFGLEASYLYWNVQQDYLGFGTEKLVFGAGISPLPDHKWNSGFRLEAIMSDNCSPIGYHAQWTYFKTSTHASDLGNTSNSLIPELQALAAPINLNNSWKITINELAFDIDYRICINPCFSLNPYLGIYGATINQRENISLFLGTAIPFNAAINRKNNFWGIGPQIGLGATWNFAQQFSFVWDTNFALLIGKIKSNLHTQLPAIISTPILNTGKTIWCTRPMTSTFLGLNWNGCVCRSIFSLSLGYEFQYWWNQWRGVDSILNQVIVAGNRNGDLALNGLVFSVGITF